MQSNLRSLVGTEFGDYRLTAVLGEGGMAVVFRGESVVHRSIVRAIKIIRPEFAAVPEFVARFGDEAGMLHKLRHPNIVDFHGVRRLAYAHGTLLAMELELLEGSSLDATLKQAAGRAFPCKQAVEIMLQASRGVAHAHSLGIVHRDLKPGNVFVLRDGRTKVVDFGIAKAFDDADRTTGMTRTGTVPGTPAYMAPEVCNGGLPDAAADVYALGVTLLEMLLGHHPYNPPGQSPKSSTQMMLAQVAHALPVVTSRRQDIPSKVAEAVERATHKQVALRHRNAGEFAAALERALADLQGNPGRVSTPVALEDEPLSTAVAIPTLGAQRGSAPPPEVAGVYTEFAVPTMQRGATTEPFALAIEDEPKPAIFNPRRLLLAAGGAVLLLMMIAVLIPNRSTPSTPVDRLTAADAGTVGSGGDPGAAAALPVTPARNRWVRVDVPSTPVPLGIDNDRAPEGISGFRPSLNVMSPEVSYVILQHEVTWAEFVPWAGAQQPVVATPVDALTTPTLPAVGVAWEAARAFCRSIGGNLPSERQWEFAARGSQRRQHPWGSDAIDASRTRVFAGVGASLLPAMSSDQDHTPGTPSSQIFDLAGNAREWTVDLYRLDRHGDESWVQANGVSYRTIRGLPVSAAPPAVLPEFSTTVRDAVCATGPCPASVVDAIRDVGFRCVKEEG